jgi:hypothetical protein
VPRKPRNPVTTTTAPTILDVIDEPAIWRSWFRDPKTWQPWRVFLAALFGLPLSKSDLELFRSCTGRTAPPTSEFNEAWLVCGRRAGKSFVLALVACYLAIFRDWRPFLSPGEVGTIKIVAVDRRQARVIHRYAKALLVEVPTLKQLVQRDSDDEIELTNGITIEIQTASFRSIRGYTIIALLADEIAFWRTDDSANPDAEILASARPAMATLQGNAKLLTAGSPYAKRGEQYRAFRDHFGRDDSPVLIWRAATRVMNETVPQSFIDAEIERDPDSASAEYGAQFRDDLADFVDRAVVEAAVATGRFELPPQPGISYVGAIDVSGGSNDSAVAAIAYADQVTGCAVLAAIREHRAPFSPELAAAEDAEFFRNYGVARVVGDRYGGGWPVDAFSRYGITYDTADRVKSDFYKDLLPLLNSGKVELLDNPRLVNQICALERRTTRGGRDSIDHPPGAHDDCANATAIALVNAAMVAAPALWRPADLRISGNAIPWPIRCDAIAISAAVDQAGVFICFWALRAHRFRLSRNGPFGPLSLLVDFDRQPLTPDLFPRVAARMVELAAMTLVDPITRREVPSAYGSGFAMVSEELLPHVEAAGLRPYRAGPQLLAPTCYQSLLLAACTQIGSQNVKISTLAEQTGHRLPLPLTAIRADAVPSAALDAALLGIAASLPEEMHPREWQKFSLAA